MIAQFLTLFSGILIDRINAVSTVESDAADTADVYTMGVLIVAINCVTMVWPLVRKVIVGKHVEYYQKIMWLLRCPCQCYMSYCGGEKRAAEQRQREKEARAAARRAAGVRREGSIKAMLPAGTPSNAQIINRGPSMQEEVSAVLQQQDIEMAVGTPSNAQIINRGLFLQGEVSAVLQRQDIETGIAQAQYRQVSTSPVASDVYPPHVLDQVEREISREEGPFSNNVFLRRFGELQKEENDKNRPLRPRERAVRLASQDIQEGMAAVATFGVSGTLPAPESGQSAHTRQNQTFVLTI